MRYAFTKGQKLLVRMLTVLLPAAALPLLLFGAVAIPSHYTSQQQQSLASHQTHVTFMGRQLEAEVSIAQAQLRVAVTSDALRSDNLAVARNAMKEWRSMSPSFARLALLDASQTLLAVEPADPAAEGKPYTTFPAGRPNDGTFLSPLYLDDENVPSFRVARAIGSVDSPSGFFVMEIALGPWLQVTKSVFKNETELLAGLLPTGQRNAHPIRVHGKADFWTKIAEIRSAGTDDTRQELLGELHDVTYRAIDGLPARLVVAQPVSAIIAAPRRVLLIYVVVMVFLVALMAALLYALVRGVTVPMEKVADAATAFADGQLEARVAVTSSDEVGTLAQTFNRMADTLNESHLKMRILYKSAIELFACGDVEALIKKAVELTCTQCQGEMAWFLPSDDVRPIKLTTDALFAKLGAWLWRNHRVSSVPPKEAGAAWKRTETDRVFSFVIKGRSRELGHMKVAYGKAPSDQMVSHLHALIALLEMAINKHEQILEGAMLTTELEMAEAVQRNIMADNLLVSKVARIAYHYQPASRLGGDWFYLIEDPTRDSLYVIMGDVTGHGLSQGLITTAVKGALDMIEQLVRHGERSVIDGPASIVGYLETVVRRVASSSQLTMTCLVTEIDFRDMELRVCNAGHTFPILVRDEGGVNTARHLHKNQQPMLGTPSDQVPPSHTYEETRYPLMPGDLLVIYTDGLTEAKDLKSRIFGRFLMRNLRKRRDYGAAEELKDEILGMFRYYTQNRQVDDDVCFLVAQMKPTKTESRAG